LDKYDDIVSKQELTRILISDFGSVKSLLKGERIPRTGNTGTIAYMPPEALMTDTSGRYLYDYDEKSDVWSAGVILYEMCYSESPFHNTESIEELEREIIGTQGITEFPRTPIPRPPIFAWLIQWMLQGDPAKRPSMDDILGIPEVRKYNTGTPRPPAPAEPPAPLSTAHLLELSSQIMQTSIPARPPTSTRPKNRQLVGPEAQIIKPRRPLCPSSPRISSGGASSASPTSAVNNPPVASVPPSPSSPQPFPKPSAVLQLPSYMMPFLGPVINFCMNHLDAFMRQSLFAIALIIKLALCYDEANRPWSSSYMHLMVSLSLGTMLLCLTTGRLMARLQVACIIGQWLLAVMCWGWLGHAHNNGTVLWELLLMMLLELMLSFLFSALKLAKTDQHKGQRLLIR
jgi:serine/threonine protein kinase